MKVVWFALICVGLMACRGTTQEKSELKTQKDSLSYSIGLDIGKNLKKQSFDIEPAILTQGIKDYQGGGKTMLTEEQAREVIMNFQKKAMAEATEKNKKEGDAFLAENKKKEGVITLPSGLQYKVLTTGTGNKPKAAETVSVNYRGTLIDGTEFDNSYKRGQPATFPVGGVIKGWTEGLQLMPVGSKWQLFIPSDLAYGERGAGQVIPPNATLIFEVELLSINK
jgi:FKBP-type peptidyl-prolyl cis-trans isomerase FklB